MWTKINSMVKLNNVNFGVDVKIKTNFTSILNLILLHVIVNGLLIPLNHCKYI